MSGETCSHKSNLCAECAYAAGFEAGRQDILAKLPKPVDEAVETVTDVVGSIQKEFAKWEFLMAKPQPNK
jgi:hypothetical protein